MQVLIRSVLSQFGTVYEAHNLPCHTGLPRYAGVAVAALLILTALTAPRLTASGGLQLCMSQ